MIPLVTTGLHHIGFVAAAPGRTRTFYRDVLGLTLLADPGPFDLLFGGPAGSAGTLIGIQLDPDARKGRWGVGGIHHLALGVADRTQQLRWKRWLTDHGVAVSGPYDRGYFHSIYFQDPDGQILEIATRGPGYDFDEPTDALGERFIEPDPERLREERDEAAIRARTHPEPVDALDETMRLDGLHHVTGIVRDLDAAHALYGDGLGLARVKRTVNQDDGLTRHDFWARYDGGPVAPHSSVTHFGWPDSDYRARPGTGQTRHVAFRAADDAELERWHDHLSALGHEPGPIRDFSLWRGLDFTVLDGLVHHLATDLP